jgi:hypothetical protein
MKSFKKNEKSTSTDLQNILEEKNEVAKKLSEAKIKINCVVEDGNVRLKDLFRLMNERKMYQQRLLELTKSYDEARSMKKKLKRRHFDVYFRTATSNQEEITTKTDQPSSTVVEFLSRMISECKI